MGDEVEDANTQSPQEGPGARETDVNTHLPAEDHKAVAAAQHPRGQAGKAQDRGVGRGLRRTPALLISAPESAE
ncbi:MAG: hypothetical protein ACREMM_13190 [Gemmatimonadales bacterium]